MRTRAALMEAGQALFSAHPVEAVSVDDIVARANVAKGSFYNHFADKDALAREIASRVRREAESAVDAANEGVTDAAERLARAICVFVRFAATSREEARALTRLHAGGTLPEAPLNAGLRADIGAGLEAGRFRDCTIATGVLFTIGIAQAAIARMLEAKPPASAEKHAAEMVALALRGLGVSTANANKIAVAAAEDIFARRNAR